jgi:hypothetical protein
MTEKILFAVVVIGERYMNIYNSLFRKSHEEYAAKCGYDFRIITEFFDKKYQMIDVVTFNKLLICSQEWAEDYDFIVIVDADILINKNAPPIHLSTDFGTSIGVVDEFACPTRELSTQVRKQLGWEVTATEYYHKNGFEIETDIGINTGVIVVQPSIHANIMQYIYKKYVQKQIGHPKKFHFEQSCIGYELLKNKFYKIIDNRFNSPWALTKLRADNTETLRQYYNSNYFIHFCGVFDFESIPGLLREINTESGGK